MRIALILFAAVCASGCATMFTAEDDRVFVSSKTSGSTVLVNGMPRGQTPVHVGLAKSRHHTIVVVNPGGQTFTCTANPMVQSGWLVLDIVAGVVPALVDATTGKWSELDISSCYSPF
jgi:hypothetical protein